MTPVKNNTNQTVNTSWNGHFSGSEACFGLAEEVYTPVNFSEEGLEPEIGNYLQQLHFKNHAHASKEIVHDLFTVVEVNSESEYQMMSAEDEFLFEDVRNAVTEREIIDLRTNFQSIAQSTTVNERVPEEIEELVGSGSGLETGVASRRFGWHRITREEKNREGDRLHVGLPKQKNLLWYAVASSVVLMLAISPLLNQRANSVEQLYASYYTPYKNGANVSRSAVASVSAVNSAVREIDKGNYSSALKMLKSASTAFQNGYSINFYSGVAYQGLGDYKNAIKSFTEVVRNGDNLLVEQSEWYIGLCYLRVDERAKAADQFRSIVSRNGFYEDQSRKLLKQLE